MTKTEIECILWCPTCNKARFEIWRRETAREGVFVNEAKPQGNQANDNLKVCTECQSDLERR